MGCRPASMVKNLPKSYNLPPDAAPAAAAAAGSHSQIGISNYFTPSMPRNFIAAAGIISKSKRATLPQNFRARGYHFFRYPLTGI